MEFHINLKMSSSTTGEKPIPSLPPEIRLQIAGYVPDLSNYYEIAQNFNQDLLKTPLWGTLNGCFTRHPLQLQKLIRFIMCIRYGAIGDLRELEQHLVQNLEGPQPASPSTLSGWKRLGRQERLPPFLILDRSYDPMSMLRSMSILSKDIEQIVQSFIAVRLYGTHERMREAKEQEVQKRVDHFNDVGHPRAMHKRHWGPDFCLNHGPADAAASHRSEMPILDADPAPPSPTELHRIRRALWRLVVYSELFHGRRPRYNNTQRSRSDNDPPNALHAFLSILTVWELEEMECVYYHLRAQVKLWKDPQGSSYLPDLARRLVDTFGPMYNTFDCYDPERKPPWIDITRHITHFIGFHRELVMGSRRAAAKTAWAEIPEANCPNAGWLYLQDHEDELNVRYNNLRMQPVRCFLNWGYCIWDRSRLEDWCLVDRASSDLLASRARSALWSYGQSRRRECEHCLPREDSANCQDKSDSDSHVHKKAANRRSEPSDHSPWLSFVNSKRRRNW